ncbi:MAG TPA: alpha-amylase family glycosyl hydrolase [Bacillota bacterium]|nr:alpha-amylase family glycosyl hydrolase [Bacillota bacterium]
MQIIVNYEPELPHEVVFIHVWEPSGLIKDLEGQKQSDGTFRFLLDIPTADARQIKFKFRYPKEKEPWEDDKWIRRVPTQNGGQIWAFEFATRCAKDNPYTGTAPNKVNIHVLSRSRYAKALLFVWNPHGPEKDFYKIQKRDETTFINDYEVSLDSWMKEGFHFKLVDENNQFEAEQFNRVWRTGDGAEVWTKSGHVNLRPNVLKLIPVTVKLIHPKAEKPELLFEDEIRDFAGSSAAIQPPQPFDDQFAISEYRVEVYNNNTIYLMRAGSLQPSALDACSDVVCNDQGATVNIEKCVREVQVEDSSSPTSFTAVLGEKKWVPDNITRSVPVEVVIHPNPQSGFQGDLTFRAGIGQEKPYQAITALRQPDQTWRGSLKAFPEITHWVADFSDGSGAKESRPDANTECFSASCPPNRCCLLNDHRIFNEPATTQPVILHTIDGASGFSKIWAPVFDDVPEATRKKLMAAAFSPEIVASGKVFDVTEMPQGSIWMDGEVWFTVKAPHAVQAKLLILTNNPAPGQPRQVKEYPMKLTSDLRYFYVKTPDSEAPHGTLYRYLLNNEQEVIDPACYWVHDPGRMWAQKEEGMEGPWSKVLYLSQLSQTFAGSTWRGKPWEELSIYEMHSLRFSLRETDDLKKLEKGFRRVIRELEPGGYLTKLGVTALELLPVHEFPGEKSWGYNPSLFSAIESSYGGPEEFARLVRKSHDANKAVILDIVYNHMDQSPMQAVAPEFYFEGETNWGPMINYSHPAALEFFRQSMVHMWLKYELDGFRVDCTVGIIDGHIQNPYVVKCPGSGCGWKFLGELHRAVQKAADASNRLYPFMVAESDPCNWPISDIHNPDHVLDSQWHFSFNYPASEAARNAEDKSGQIQNEMKYPDPLFEGVRAVETHDQTSKQEDYKKRIASRAKWGEGYRMSKALGALVILAKGTPMLFMGQEAGETEPFYFPMDILEDPSLYLHLDVYERDWQKQRILAWFNQVMAFRNNGYNGFQDNDNQRVGRGNKTIAFTRGKDEQFFIINTVGTPDTRQDLAWLGLKPGVAYKESCNSSWPAFQVESETEYANGGYNARLYAGNIVNLPPIGTVILERV